MTGAIKAMRYIGADDTHLDYWLEQIRSAKLVSGLPAPDGVELVNTDDLLPWLIEHQWYGVFDAPKEFEELRERWNETYTTVNGIAYSDEQPLIGLARIDAHPIPTVEWQGRAAHTFAEITMGLCDDVAEIVSQMRTKRRFEHTNWDTLQRIATYKHDAFDGLDFDTLELNLQGEFRRMEVTLFGHRRQGDPRDPNNPALWSKARLIKEWLKIIGKLTGDEFSHDTFCRRMTGDIYTPHPVREGHKVRLLLASLPVGYDDSK
jgi:hypothetical protein